MMSRIGQPSLAAFVCLIPLLFACGDEVLISYPFEPPVQPEPEPEFEPQVSNERGRFSFEANDLSNVSQNVSFTWEHDGSVVILTQSSHLTGGRATLTIRRRAGTIGVVAYSHSLAEDGTFTLNIGRFQPLHLEVTLSNVSGALNFRLQSGS